VSYLSSITLEFKLLSFFTIIPTNSRCDDIWYAVLFLAGGGELMMFVRSVHCSDYLEQDLCIQDEFTIPTSPCIMSSKLVLSST
jgi:hypothetical protein